MSIPSTAKQQIPALTSLRFFAAIMVVFCHYAWWWRPSTVPGLLQVVAKNGYVAVSFFFILSGFILTLTYLREDGTLRCPARVFWWARMARIVPVYMFALALGVGPLLARHGGYAIAGAPGHITSTVIAADLTFSQSWLPGGLDGFWDGPAWSVSAEMCFYLAFPLLAPLLVRRRVKETALLCWLLGMAATFATGDQYGHHPLVRVPEFALGILLGWCYLRGVRVPRALLGAAALLLLAVLAGVPLQAGTLGTQALDPLFAVVILGMATRGGWVGSPPLVRLGEASYALYLLHWPLWEWLAPLHLSLPAYLLVLVAVSLGVYRYLEAPARQVLRTRTQSSQPRAARTAGAWSLPGEGAGSMTGRATRTRIRLLLALAVALACLPLVSRATPPVTQAARPSAAPPRLAALRCYRAGAPAGPVIGFLGDSITNYRQGGTSPGAIAAQALHARAEVCAVPGSATADWLATPRFRAAIRAFAAAHVHLVSVMLGDNDCRRAYPVPVATYRAHLLAIVAALHTAGFRVAVQTPPLATTPGYDLRLLARYRAVIARLGLPGTRGALTMPVLDGVHPTAAGVRLLGHWWAASLQEVR